jgi:hypothetical protein
MVRFRFADELALTVDTYRKAMGMQARRLDNTPAFCASRNYREATFESADGVVILD